MDKLVVEDLSLEEYFDETTFWRGLNYAEQGRVLSAEWAPEARQLEGAIRGGMRRQSGSRPAGRRSRSLALICHAREHQPDGAPWLIVAPASVVANWAEAARFTPKLRTVTVTDTFARSGRTLDELTADIDILVTSYTLLRLDIEQYAGHRWAGVILDEAQFVKNHQTKVHQGVRRLDREFTLAITGTPMENHLISISSRIPDCPCDRGSAR
ncbi:SNF2-related protein [Nocardia sp. NPDC059228]|uniref:SNF2-related protein n=1 Tax=Nocardia sp. NPDC059228 TaxID=3346777 RepID=UPI0036BAAD71